MTAPRSRDELRGQVCQPCEGGIPRMSRDEILLQLPALPEWEYATGPDRIRRSWIMRDFGAAIEFINLIAALAEAEAHHPDLHLIGYRHIRVEIWTHAIQGLSVNDFVLASKIDGLPVRLRTP